MSERKQVLKGAEVHGFRAEDFGADLIKASYPNAFGGWHYTAFSKTGGQISWDTDDKGEHVPESEHMSDRNVGTSGGFNVWLGSEGRHEWKEGKKVDDDRRR